MKKIGRQVLFLNTGAKNPRNGEGSLIRLKDGSIMYAYTQYYGDEGDDHATARIAACHSYDEGESWTDSRVLVAKDDEALNIMSVSLLRMQNGDLGVFYLRKSMKGEDLLCMPYLVRSADEGKSFEAPVCCCAVDGYFVVNNDRAVRLKSGRIVIPAAAHGESGYRARPGRLRVMYSDDDGRSWQISQKSVCSPYNDPTQLQEPGIYQLPDGRLWMWCRTAYGHQYQCFSEDDGASWSSVIPCFRFTSPDSPMQVRCVGDCTLAIFNPLGYSCVRDDTELWKSPKRTPYVCAVSRDGGFSFIDATHSSANGGFDSFVENCYLLEDDRSNSYCYPALLEVENGFLVAYYHSNGTPACLNCAKITKVSFNELCS